ncbi:hypothetical protein [Streptococcus mutans]|uniref:PTS fructose transporter subunit IA n=1 Tax=Streptococcus mutans SM6 TaxID=857119 RepID=A0A829BV57_STRMG|nr:hypothetical protein [Streptococcus mutans]EMB76208.1 hypothetical protein SMU41_03909 [Streptococcus mutans 2VS1]EMB94723.1 hypothetical protein SMU62_08623 [Streptococcus mutans M21]EMB96724.1 hypothetical protein SMU61_01687 [Streptococcus mutans G123]EMC04024.1 hypothetical protein SMU69_08669 [Streptococcus mutans NLML4]EMC08070.1 hypothetical protein SMU72_07364 [Streptococcus mutans NLML9]
MLTEKEFIKGYENEITYQKHMIENLGRWFTLMFIIASIGVVLIYLFSANLVGFTIGIVLTALGFLAMLVFGYGIYKGRLNVQKVVDDFEEKLRLANSK